MKKIRITQVKSGIDRMAIQKRTLIALGIKKMHHSVVLEATPQVEGMVRAVRHLVTREEI